MCHVVIVHSCSITCMCHVFYNHFRLSFFFYIFVYFNSTCHVSFVSLHAFKKYLSFFTCLCNVSYYHSSCECRLFAKFLQNKLPYWHWCYWGDLVKKRREKLNQSSLLNKNMYQSSVIHLHHFFFYLHISRFVKFKVRHEMSSVLRSWLAVCTHCLITYTRTCNTKIKNLGRCATHQ